ncbi:peptide/nickel transport system permease protein [Clostridium tetanomorphum]|uniref:ABC transporter permease n=1 Tax=Clostridium tetanomorphum TaxID=1553 RepID=A0A923J3F4_CLOTT|nr:ABC transporter permease [Clostridium tetanomorphum]KAJ49355.1 binding-protein-dependent transport systems inner membrane component [Clostridium tetanomorphum DSM 665]KAJ53322.1 binding-protein-dependent transport systems inner membrane component [Clostridium tetanomorphum DSM 665]MBC2400090.1 ABC transporter permease [Clostridium tetanomorphum]MBP1866273.1 peptide/nickel transport system permease protein [Clostridium tetanomorphum]NRS86043.1 peptide/nickel transport system permease protein
MVKYILKRILLLIPVIIGVSILVFLVMHVFTTDPASIILGQHATAEQVEKLREELGLNKPLYIQYLMFLKGVFKGSFGNSLITKTSVAKEILSRFPATIELALVAIVIASVCGVVMGVISAVKQNSIADYISMVISLLGVSMPIFWLGLMLIVLFSVKLHLLPVSGRISIGMEPTHVTGLYLLDSLLTGNVVAFKDSLKHLILPSIALASYSTAIIARMTRSTMLEIIKQDYIRTARAKGLFEKVVILKHALRNALIPVTTVIGLQLGSLLGGAVLTETVFAWPGVGSYTIDAILKSDYPVVQGSVMILATVFVLVNLVVDLLYAYLDPRIKYS